MILTWWSTTFVTAIIVVTASILTWGIKQFSPQRALNVKYAERSQEVIAHVIEVRREHPEIVRVSRHDRHPAFLLLPVMVLGYSISVFCGAQLTSNVTALGDSPRYTMATCFLIGSVLMLAGATLGLRIGRRRLSPHVHDHLTAEVLGDDIVFPYRLSMAGMGAMIVSSSIYWWTSFQSTFGSLGGWLTLAITSICVVCIPWFLIAAHRFTKWDRILITEAQARIDAGESSAD